jgi:hypothetical protein
MLRFSIELRPEMHVSLNLHQAAEEERDRGLESGSHEQALLRDLLASRLGKSPSSFRTSTKRSETRLKKYKCIAKHREHALWQLLLLPRPSQLIAGRLQTQSKSGQQTR